MKRAPELHVLSEDHHHGLVAARRLRRAAAGERSLEEAIERFLEAWEGEIRHHFQVEEEVLVPAFSPDESRAHPLVQRLFADHADLRQAVAELPASRGEARRELARKIGAALDDHIRFEERILFPAVEEELAGDRLARLGEAISRVASRRAPPGD